MTISRSQGVNNEANIPGVDEADRLFIRYLMNNNLNSIISIYERMTQSDKSKFREDFLREQNEERGGKSDSQSMAQVSPPEKDHYQTPPDNRHSGLLQTAAGIPFVLRTPDQTSTNSQTTTPTRGNSLMASQTIVGERLQQSNGGESIRDISNPSQKDIKTAADTLWRKTKFPKEDDWVFSGLYCRRIQRSINDVFDEDSWRKWRDGIKRQLNKKRNSVTQMVKDEYIGKKKR